MCEGKGVGKVFYSIEQGDAIGVLRTLPDEGIQCCVTSPPYWGLRDYKTEPLVWGGEEGCAHEWGSRLAHGRRGNRGVSGTGGNLYPTLDASGAGPGSGGGGAFCINCGAWRGSLGLEPTPEMYVYHLVDIFREVRRVLRGDGTLWLNLGDSYAASRGYQVGSSKGGPKHSPAQANQTSNTVPAGLKPKDLIGIPWRVALALQADGWWLRSDIIWCLSGGTLVYARTQKGDMPTTIKDLSRLKPETVKLWNGTYWTSLLGMSKSKRTGDELEIVLRSGERISCTPNHKFPTEHGMLEAGNLRIGDVLKVVRLPQPEPIRFPLHIEDDAAWFAGLYIAEGSRSGDTIQIAGHAKEQNRWERVKRVAESYGGSATRTVQGNSMDIRVYGKLLNAIIDELTTGRVAKDKGFAPAVWRYSDRFLESMMRGYLYGDGHWDEKNQRWRLGFTRNYNLERDLRTACARLGWYCVLKLSHVSYQGKKQPTFRGEIRYQRRGHWNEKPLSQIVEIRKARCREVYDLGVADQPHTFALASGILTHNSKPNSMPESVRDRPTRSHEYMFLLAKSERYRYDADAIAEPCVTNPKENYPARAKITGRGTQGAADARGGDRDQSGGFPPKQDRVGNRTYDGFNAWWDDAEANGTTPALRNRRDVWTIATRPYRGAHFATFPPALVEPCILAGCPPGGTVIDPFAGSGTTLMVSLEHGRSAIGIELNPEYIKLAEKRIQGSSKAMEAIENDE